MMKGGPLIHVKEIEQYLHDHIPLSKAMGVQVQVASWESVELLAPLGPNINHQETVFGGSACAVAILSAWSFIHVRLKLQGASGRIVIHRNTMLYERPIADEFTAIATMPDEAAWPKLLAALKRKRMVRISVPAVVHCKGEMAGKLEGEFVVLPPST